MKAPRSNEGHAMTHKRVGLARKQFLGKLRLGFLRSPCCSCEFNFVDFLQFVVPFSPQQLNKKGKRRGKQEETSRSREDKMMVDVGLTSNLWNSSANPLTQMLFFHRRPAK